MNLEIGTQEFKVSVSTLKLHWHIPRLSSEPQASVDLPDVSKPAAESVVAEPWWVREG